MNKFNREDSNYFGGAVLADDSCGSVSLYSASGSVLKVHVSDDPEFMLSGFYAPYGALDDYRY